MNCSICFEDLKNPFKLKKCSHIFCTDCLCKQLKSLWPEIPKCPLCRESLKLFEFVKIYSSVRGWKIIRIISKEEHSKNNFDYLVLRENEKKPRLEPSHLLRMVEGDKVRKFEENRLNSGK